MNSGSAIKQKIKREQAEQVGHGGQIRLNDLVTLNMQNLLLPPTGVVGSNKHTN